MAASLIVRRIGALWVASTVDDDGVFVLVTAGKSGMETIEEEPGDNELSWNEVCAS